MGGSRYHLRACAGKLNGPELCALYFLFLKKYFREFAHRDSISANVRRNQVVASNAASAALRGIAASVRLDEIY